MGYPIQPFAEVASRYDGPRLEQTILDFWREHDVFAQTLALSKGRPLFTFNEGPPTANGRPGIHHVLARTFKDIFPRYKTMRGFHVPRRAGWDTHGLPVEHEVEKELGIFDKSRIQQEVGINEFTRRCRESVMRYIGEWERMTERMAFWVDLENAYSTLDNRYIESVWNLLRIIWDKGLIYQDYKVVPYDPRIGATLSSHEVAQGYREVRDPSITVYFPLLDEAGGRTGTSLLVWTTTPWTLPANLAAAVNPEAAYARVVIDEPTANKEGSTAKTLILARDRVASVMGTLPYRILAEMPGSALVGLRYERPLDYLTITGTEACWRVLAADFVSTEDGTGIVHIAPAYGADDLALAKANGIPVLHGVGLDGCFLPAVEPVAGVFFKDADARLTQELKARGKLFRAETTLHNYPFGWRTGDPLIYYAKNAWYIRTTAVKNAMVAHNQEVNWVPESIREGRFGNWLENNVDWALSRERFWGTPLPLWSDSEGDHIMVGSLAELEHLTGRSLQDLDLHRPAVDEVTFKHPQTGREMRRVPEVIDCWFDSGAMSYAQWHYPFENSDTFADYFPADYICEAIDQTRGWFYTLHAIGSLVSDSKAFRNVVCLSHLVDGEGKKMSKSQGNIVDPYAVFDKIGADPLRWYFLVRVAPDQQKRISEGIVADVAGTFVNTLWNTYAFFVLYANLDRIDLAQGVPVPERPEIDRWALALLHRTVTRVTEHLDAFDAKGAGEAIEHLVDQLSNWYVRRNRRRFWKSDAGADKQAAYLTLHECLVTVTRLIAPFMPFLAEELFQNLVRTALDDKDTSAPRSVHQDLWPEANAALLDDPLVDVVSVVRQVVGLGRAARATSNVRVRQPLPQALVRVPDECAAHAIERQRGQILDELNIKEVRLLAQDDEIVTYRLKPNLKLVGKKYGKLVPAIRKGLADIPNAARREWVANASAGVESPPLILDGREICLAPEELLIETKSAAGYVSAEEGGYLVALDTRLDESLKQEGLARELVRSVQDARKQAGLEVSDRIHLRIVNGSSGGSDGRMLGEVTDRFRQYIMSETLTTKWAGETFEPSHTTEQAVDGYAWRIELRKVE